MAFTVSGSGPPGAATLISPKGTITDTTPTYTWNAVSNATWYQLYVRQGTSGSVFVQWYTAASVTSGSTCSVTPTKTLNAAAHTWWIQTYNSYGYGPWSSGMAFTVSGGTGGFNSQFNGSAAGWGAYSGAWYVDSNYLYSAGLSSNSSSVGYNATYSNFDYQVRLYRSPGCDGCANRIMVRGTPSPLFGTNNWYAGYYFQYTRSGYYSVWKHQNGSTSVVKDWTYSSAISQGSTWNTLRVVASGSTIYFYINGTYLGTISNTSLTSGKVGIGFYDTGNLYVDWATLTPLYLTGAYEVSETATGEFFAIDDSLDREPAAAGDMDVNAEDRAF